MVLPDASNVPEYLRIKIYQGDDYVLPYTVSNDDGTLRDITNDAILMQARRAPNSPTVAFSWTIEKNNPTQGSFLAKLLGADSALIPCGAKPYFGASLYWYDARITGAGFRKTLRYGPAIIYAGVSR